MSTLRHITEPTIAPPVPKEIHVTITEGDRQSAGGFGSCSSCILATALKRMGYHVIAECIQRTHLKIGENLYTYRHEPWGIKEARFDILAPHPQYAPEVVGKSLVLTLAQ